MNFITNFGNNYIFPKQYNNQNTIRTCIPLINKEIKDTVSFKGIKENAEQQKFQVYDTEMRLKIFDKRKLSRAMRHHLKDLENSQFHQAITALNKGYFCSQKQPIAFSLGKFAQNDEETFK